MRILYLTEEPISFSGAMVRGGAIHVRNVVQGLRSRGHDVLLLDWNDDPERPYQHSLSPRIRFVVDPARTVRRAVSVGRANGVDVIVSKTRKTYLPGLAAAKCLGVPHVVHVGSSLETATTGGTLNEASLSLRLRAPHTSYLVVGTNIVDQLRRRGVHRNRIYNVGNAVDTKRFRPDGTDTESEQIRSKLDDVQGPILGFVGGLHDYKGVYDLAVAVERSETDFRVLIAGDGPERADLEDRFGGNAVFLGSVPYEEMPAVYEAMDLFVLPSHTEGIPRVILEAQASGTPVIATRVGGIPDVIDHRESGLLCDPRDTDELASLIDEVVDEPPLRSSLAEKGRKQVLDSYSWERMYDRYERSLSAVLEETPRGRG